MVVLDVTVPFEAILLLCARQCVFENVVDLPLGEKRLVLFQVVLAAQHFVAGQLVVL